MKRKVDNILKIKISEDFSDNPYGRYPEDSEFSGERFREEFLKPKYLEAKSKSLRLLVDLDGGYGYPTTFLQEVFGGLSQQYPKDDIFKVIELKSENQPSLISTILQTV